LPPLKEEKMLKLSKKLIGDNYIYLITEKRSVCELDRMDNFLIESFSTLDLTPPVFWFSRLKAFKEGEGEGSFLMSELCKILDEKQATVVNIINPYGKMSRKNLTNFYKKYGFKDCNGVMIRRPQKL
jgi:hypothetical protein